MSEARANPDAALPERPTSILLAEDEHLVAANIRDNLVRLKYNVVGPATNGQEAVELARQHRPNLALLDIRMPVLDGLAAAKILFEQLSIPVIIISAYSDPEYLQQGARVGVFGYLLKPVTLDELNVTVTVGWSRYRDQCALSEQVTQLKTALEDRKVIERAKGLLMDKLGLSENDAMRRLQKQARDSRRKLADLARALLESQELLGGPVEKKSD